MSVNQTIEEKRASKNIELYLPIMSEICEVKEESSAEKFFKIRLPHGKSLGHNAGQFVEVSIFGKGEAPISICSSPTRGPEFDLTVRNVGSLTSQLHKYKVGDMVGIRGPFGRGFNVQELKGKNALIIGGGIGIVPLRGLIHYIIDNREDYKDVTILYGSKSPSEIIFRDELKEWENANINLKLTVDTAEPGSWSGNVGLITTLIPPLEIDTENTFVYIVGPPIMYKFVIQELNKKKVPHNKIIVSLERYMKCGVGKCGHCTIGNYYCCTDGPIFTYEEIENIKEAL